VCVRCINVILLTAFLTVTGRPARSTAMPVLFLLSGTKKVFRPAGATRCPDKRKIWHGGAGPPNFTFIRAEMWEYSPVSPKLSKFQILAINLCLRGDSFALFYDILRFCTRPYVAFKFLVWSLSGEKQRSYKHFPAVMAFSHRFSIAPSGETTDQIKKVRGVAKMARTSSITVPSIVGIVGRVPAVDEKV